MSSTGSSVFNMGDITSVMEEASLALTRYQGSSDSNPTSSSEDLPPLLPLLPSPDMLDVRSLSSIVKDHALCLVGAVRYTVLKTVWQGRPPIRQAKFLLPPPAGPNVLPRFNHAGTMHFDVDWYKGPSDRCNAIFLLALAQMVEETVVSIFWFFVCEGY